MGAGLHSLRPYLSIVATARNDNHGGDLLRRMQAWLDGIAMQSEMFQIPVELLLVEWNPPPTAPRLKDILLWPTAHAWLTARVVEVPTELHRCYRYAQRLPLYQMIAKNVGVRRARGDFLLCTNIDILFSNEVWKFLAQRELDSRVLYRANRHDVASTVLDESSHSTRLGCCDREIVRINTRFGTRNMHTGEYRSLYPQTVDQLPVVRRSRTPLHFMACGDFQLAGRKLWHDVRGYPELDAYSLHIDSLFNLNAHYGGKGERVLDDNCRVFHVEHGGGWQPEQRARSDFFRAMAQRRVPVLSDAALNYFNRRVSEVGTPRVLNNEHWGMAGLDLAEHWPTIAAWDEAKAPDRSSADAPLRLKKGLRRMAVGVLWLQFTLNQTIGWIQNGYQRTVVGMRRLRGKPMRVAIFGAGPSGERVLERCEKARMNVAFFIDNGYQQQNPSFRGIPVYPVGRVADGVDAELDAIVLASKGWQLEMRRQLRDIGCRVPIIY